MATCFHHTDRGDGRGKPRCGRPACPDCLIQASVGSQCFECVKRGAPKKTVRIRQTLQRDPLIAPLTQRSRSACFALIALRDGSIRNGCTPRPLDLPLRARARSGEWWRLLSYSLVHFGLIHIGGNLLVLWIVGRSSPGTGLIAATLYVVSVTAVQALVDAVHGLTGGERRRSAWPRRRRSSCTGAASAFGTHRSGP